MLPAKRTIGQSLGPIARIRIAVDIQILRERNRPFSQLVLRLNIKQPDPEALDQIISKRTSSQRRSSAQKLLPGAAALSVGHGWTQGQCLAMGMWFSEREKNLFAGHLRRDFLSSRA